MISKKVLNIIKISLLIIGFIGSTIGAMYLVSRMICKKQTGAAKTACCSGKHHSHGGHKHHN